MRRFLLACALILLSAPAYAQRDGLYDVTGQNLDGTDYTGVAQIRSVGLNSFNIVWRIGSQLVEGVGMASGRTISVAYGMAQQPGMGIYTLNPDGSLDGEWTIIGAMSIGRERMVPRAAEAPASPPAASSPPATTEQPAAPAAPATPSR